VLAQGANVFEVEVEGERVRVNGREFRLRSAEGYVEELEAAHQLARSWQATLRELAEELERDPRAAEERLRRLLEDLAGAKGLE
jgi:chromosome segregation ATPase